MKGEGRYWKGRDRSGKGREGKGRGRPLILDPPPQRLIYTTPPPSIRAFVPDIGNLCATCTPKSVISSKWRRIVVVD